MRLESWEARMPEAMKFLAFKHPSFPAFQLFF
jgi:hypothetical protein